MSAFLGVPVGAAYHLVFALTQLLTPVAGGLAAAAAIILFTAAARLLISPLSLRALRGQAATARLAPQVQSLRTRHRGQPERLQRELTALYKREAVSPFAGFLPLLAQWPLLSVLYLLFRSATVDGGPNQLLTGRLFGVPLGAHWLSGAALLSPHDAVFLAVFAALAGLCWLSARLARRTAPVSATPGSAAPGTAARGGAARGTAARGGGARGGGARGGAARGGAARGTAARGTAARGGAARGGAARGGAAPGTAAGGTAAGGTAAGGGAAGGGAARGGAARGGAAPGTAARGGAARPRASMPVPARAGEPGRAETVPGAAAAGVLRPRSTCSSPSPGPSASAACSSTEPSPPQRRQR